MTGKTHMAISTATSAVVLHAVRAGFPEGTTYMLPVLPLEPGSSRPALLPLAGLLFLGMVAGLFPDLDAPDTELQHLPRRVGDGLAKYIRAGMRRHSLFSDLAQGVVRLAAHSVGLALDAMSVALRAFTSHRGFTHTLWGAVTFCGLAACSALLTSRDVGCTLLVSTVWASGYMSHLLADACTPAGIPLFGHRRVAKTSLSGTRARTGRDPYRGFTFHLLPEGMRIRTGTLPDTLLIRWASWGVCILVLASMFVAS